jgi:flagellar assembly protein FliH
VASSSRILSAGEFASFEPFSLDALPAFDEHGREPVAAGAAGRPAADDRAAPPDLAAFEKAWHEGFEEGRARALAETDAHAAQVGAAFERRALSLLASLQAELEAFQSRHADRVVDLALAIARQVVGSRVDADRSVVLPVIHEALDHLQQVSAPATLFVDPLDLALVADRLGPSLAQRRVTIAPDPEVGAGGCRLVSDEVEIDATLATRWQRLLGAMGRSTDAGPIEPEPATEESDR